MRCSLVDVCAYLKVADGARESLPLSKINKFSSKLLRISSACEVQILLALPPHISASKCLLFLYLAGAQTGRSNTTPDESVLTAHRLWRAPLPG